MRMPAGAMFSPNEITRMRHDLKMGDKSGESAAAREDRAAAIVRHKMTNEDHSHPPRHPEGSAFPLPRN